MVQVEESDSRVAFANRRRRALWEAVSRAVALLLVVGAGILGLWVTSRNSIRNEFRHYLLGLAEVAATLVDTDLHQKLRHPEQLNDPDYIRAVTPLRRMRKALPDIHYVYTLVKEQGVMHFVLDAADPGAKSPFGGADQSGVWEVYESSEQPLARAFGNEHGPGVPAATAAPITDKWGTFMSGVAPLRDPSGRQIGVIGVDVDAGIYLERLREARDRALLGLLPAGILISIFGWWYYRVRLRGLAAVAARNTMELALREAAQQDRLTGLPNRAAFMERLGQTLRQERRSRFAVLFLDFDRFKLINDTRGHEAGDELLRQIGARLQAALRPCLSDSAGPGSLLISRFGGDEFLILIEEAHGNRDPVRVADYLLAELQRAYSLLGSEVHSMASIGIVTCEAAAQPLSAEEIVRNADVAMYEAKHAGRGCYVVFDEAMHARVERHVAIENSLHRAVGSAEMDLEYQPIVDLQTGRRPYVEALLRWQHPTLGLIEPRELIPIAEESGLMGPLGHWVLEQACRAMVRWRAQDPQNAPEAVSVNISRVELALGERLLTQVNAILAATGLPPGCLQLEVTEREVTRNPDVNRELLRKVRLAGIRVAMDDFGTGHSTLTLLRGHEFDCVKIDSSFFQELNSGPEALAVIHAAINLIENLNMASVATGVEDGTQVAILQSFGCRYAQGLHFSAPVPADRVLDMLKSHGAAAQ